MGKLNPPKVSRFEVGIAEHGARQDAMNPAAKLACLAILAAFMPSLSPAEDRSRDAREIMRKIDALYRSDSSQARFEMEIVTPHWKRTLKIDAWSKGMDKTLLRILEPKKEAGMATLRIDDEMWNFLPRTSKVIKVPPSMMMGSWMGSDFTNDDLVKEYSFLEDYQFEIAGSDDPEPNQIVVQCIPRRDRPIVWGRVMVAVRENDYLPVWQRYYDEKGKLMRELSFRDIKTFSGRTIPAVMELRSAAREGSRTVIRYLDVRFDIELADDVFSLRNLRSGL